MTHEERLSARIDANMDRYAARDVQDVYWGDRDKTIADAPSTTITTFWCRKCRKDRDGLGEKRVISWDGESFAYYHSYRLCHSLRRYITDRHIDPYWRESRELKKQRAIHAQDILQPGDDGFDMLYSHKN